MEMRNSLSSSHVKIFPLYIFESVRCVVNSTPKPKCSSLDLTRQCVTCVVFPVAAKKSRTSSSVAIWPSTSFERQLYLEMQVRQRSCCTLCRAANPNSNINFVSNNALISCYWIWGRTFQPDVRLFSPRWTQIEDGEVLPWCVVSYWCGPLVPVSGTKYAVDRRSFEDLYICCMILNIVLVSILHWGDSRAEPWRE